MEVGPATSAMEVQLVLCDWAEAVGGKVYIMGAGWTRLAANAPAPVAAAVFVRVPWDQTNRQHAIALALLTEDGHPVSPAVPGVPPEVVVPPVRLEGKFEVGRPAGTREGSPLAASFAFRAPALSLNPGRYSFQLQIDGDPYASAPFEVVAPQTGGHPG